MEITIPTHITSSKARECVRSVEWANATFSIDSRVFVTILKLLQFIAINVIENNSIMVCIKMSNEIWFTWVNRAKDAP